MKRAKPVALIERGACIAVLGLMLMALPSASANAQQPPRKGCVEVDKSEYKIANRNKLHRTRFGVYVRTGRLFRRHYWYCP